MVASVCTSSDMHSSFSKGNRYSMNRTEFALLVRKISVPDPVIYGVFVLAAGILVHHMTPDIMPPVMMPFAYLSMTPSMVSGLLLCSAICLFCVCYLTRHLFGDGLWLIMLFALGFISAEAELMRHADTSLLAQKTRGILVAEVTDRTIRDTNRMRLILRPLKGRTTEIFGELSFVRLSTRIVDVLPGDIIVAGVTLFPLSGPLLPDRPDYARQHYLSGIGASGFATWVKIVRHETNLSFSERAARYRLGLATRITASMSEPYGGIAAALLVGVRDNVPADVYTKFRRSGLAHLLAISGLHMGLFCFSVLYILRAFMALLPHISQHYPVHKYASLVALGCGALYLLGSGIPVSAVRAFLMTSLIILALLTDRHVVSVRNLALVAAAFLIVSPSVIYTAAFQLSFSATMAVIGTFQLTRMLTNLLRMQRAILFIFLSSVMTFLATMPFAAYHFGQIAPIGIFANLIAIPLTGLMIMPAGVLLLLASLFGLTNIVAPVMEVPLSVLCAIADIFSDTGLSGWSVKPPPSYLLFGAACGGALVIMPRTYPKMIGLVILCLMAMHWAVMPRPVAIIFQASGGLVLAVRSDSDEIIVSKSVSPFWQDNLRLMLGGDIIRTQRCSRYNECQIIAKRAQTFSLYAQRPARMRACPEPDHIMITTDERHDSCLETITSGDSIILSPRRSESWLLYQSYTDSSYKLVSNKARYGLAEQVLLHTKTQ